MRRILLSLVALSSAALLAACSQGGSAFNTNSTQADRVVVTANGDGQSLGIAKVVPGSSIVLSAQAVNSPNNTVNATGQYTWTVVPVGSGTYTNGGGTVFPCPTINIVPPTTTASTFSNSSTGNNLTVVAPSAATAFGSATLAATQAYCLVATATFVPSGAQGSITIYVSPTP